MVIIIIMLTLMIMKTEYNDNYNHDNGKYSRTMYFAKFFIYKNAEFMEFIQQS